MDLKLRLAHELQFHLLPRELPSDAPVSIAAVPALSGQAGDLAVRGNLDAFALSDIDQALVIERAGRQGPIVEREARRAVRPDRCR